MRIPATPNGVKVLAQKQFPPHAVERVAASSATLTIGRSSGEESCHLGVCRPTFQDQSDLSLGVDAGVQIQRSAKSTRPARWSDD